LAVFVLTHPDLDHCQGFADLLKRVTIGELWFTPRVFREFHKDLCTDAQAFRTEAHRRLKLVIKNQGSVVAGDRIRIIGYDELLQEDGYKDLPRSCFSIPGHEVSTIGGVDLSTIFRAFIHAPFKDDADGERNDTSLGLQVTLNSGEASGKALLLGDLCYPTIQRIFTVSDPGDVKWNVFLAPHHCSKSVMYWKDAGEDDESLKQCILDLVENSAEPTAYVVSSSAPIPTSNASGDNPPHALAKDRYQEIAPSGFLCTQEHPNEHAPEPIIFAVNRDGFKHVAPLRASIVEAGGSLHGAIKLARGSYEAPSHRVGHG